MAKPENNSGGLTSAKPAVVVLSPASKTATPPSLSIALHSSHKGGSLALGFVGSGSSWPPFQYKHFKEKGKESSAPPPFLSIYVGLSHIGKIGS
jgi:hypothetical protein